jgi:hypothetical protein
LFALRVRIRHGFMEQERMLNVVVPAKKFGLLALCTSIIVGPALAQTPFDESGGNFAASVEYQVGTNPYAVVAADLDADGVMDLAVSNTGSDSVSVLLGTGGGAFAPATSFATGDGTEGLAAADVDGDGVLDIIAANLWSSSVSVLIGTGNGSFGVASYHAVGANPHQVVIADFNGDGNNDIATANGGAGTVSVLPGTGTGGFGAAVHFFSGVNPRDLKVGEFNNDGKLDFVVTNEGGASVSILSGNGAGGFSAPSTFAVGDRPQTVSVADFNADSKQDLAVASLNDNKVSILLGTGAGGFTAAGDVSLNAVGFGTATADIDGDGAQDLIVASGNDYVSVFRGGGTGAFASGTAFPAATGVNRVVVAYVDEDTKLDLVVVNSGDASISILRNDSTPPLNIAPSATVDLTSSYTLRKVPLWINRQTSGTYPASYPYSHAGYADIDRDGDFDFLRTFADNQHRFPVQVMINAGPGGFVDQTSGRIIGTQPELLVPRKVLSGDYNGDNWPDFFVVPHGIDAPPFVGEYPQMFLSNGDGTLSYAPGLESEIAYHHAGASADVDGNGTIDVLLGGNTKPFLLINDGSGHFTKNTVRLPRDENGQLILFISAEFVDVDLDGFIDLVVDGYEPIGSPNSVFWGSSTGFYRRSNMTVLPPVADMGITLDFAVEDIDGDGKRDIIVNRTGSTNVYSGRALQILRQTTSRQFADESASRISMNTSLPPIDFVRAQDVDGDGVVDLFIDDRNDVSSGEYAWKNNGQGVFTPYSGPVSPSIALFLDGFER